MTRVNLKQLIISISCVVTAGMIVGCGESRKAPTGPSASLWSNLGGQAASRSQQKTPTLTLFRQVPPAPEANPLAASKTPPLTTISKSNDLANARGSGSTGSASGPGATTATTQGETTSVGSAPSGNSATPVFSQNNYNALSANSVPAASNPGFVDTLDSSTAGSNKTLSSGGPIFTQSNANTSFGASTNTAGGSTSSFGSNSGSASSANLLPAPQNTAALNSSNVGSENSENKVAPSFRSGPAPSNFPGGQPAPMILSPSGAGTGLPNGSQPLVIASADTGSGLRQGDTGQSEGIYKLPDPPPPPAPMNGVALVVGAGGSGTGGGGSSTSAATSTTGTTSTASTTATNSTTSTTTTTAAMVIAPNAQNGGTNGGGNNQQSALSYTASNATLNTAYYSPTQSVGFPIPDTAVEATAPTYEAKGQPRAATGPEPDGKVAMDITVRMITCEGKLESTDYRGTHLRIIAQHQVIDVEIGEGNQIIFPLSVDPKAWDTTHQWAVDWNGYILPPNTLNFDKVNPPKCDPQYGDKCFSSEEIGKWAFAALMNDPKDYCNSTNTVPNLTLDNNNSNTQTFKRQDLLETTTGNFSEKKSFITLP